MHSSFDHFNLWNICRLKETRPYKSSIPYHFTSVNILGQLVTGGRCKSIYHFPCGRSLLPPTLHNAVLNTALHNTKLQTLLSLNFSALKRAELRCMLKCSVEHPPSRFPFAVKGRSVKKKPNVPASSQASLAQVDMAFHGRGSGPVGKP